MPGINSRSKGARNERRAAELFTVWTGKKFSKTPASGGLHWKNQNSIGDVICTTEGHFFPFAAEVKAHKEINFEHLLLDVNCKIKEFWAQCSRDAKRGKKIPMLLMRYDRMPSEMFFLVLGPVFFTVLQARMPEAQKLVTVGYHNPNGGSIAIMDSRDFFKLPYKEVKAIAKAHLKAKYVKK